MKDSIEKIRMTTEEREWWEKMIREEEERVKLWDSPNEEDYTEAGKTFDLSDFKYSMPDPDPTDKEDKEYYERNANLLCLIERKENHQPVSYPSTYTCLSVIVSLTLFLNNDVGYIEMSMNITLNSRLCMLIAAIFLPIN